MQHDFEREREAMSEEIATLQRQLQRSETKMAAREERMRHDLDDLRGQLADAEARNHQLR